MAQSENVVLSCQYESSGDGRRNEDVLHNTRKDPTTKKKTTGGCEKEQRHRKGNQNEEIAIVCVGGDGGDSVETRCKRVSRGIVLIAQS